jgi:Mg2+-importing ATPase
MDVLCTDKTGTLTRDHVILERHCDVVLQNDDSVLELAFLNSHFRTGLKNLLDRAVPHYAGRRGPLAVSEYSKVDEVPFDFIRKVMSVVVKRPEGAHRLTCEEAPEAVFARCTRYELDGEPHPIQQMSIGGLRAEHDQLSADGFRVLALAYKDLPAKAPPSKDDEGDLVLKGNAAFLDPPKETALEAVRGLREHGVAVKGLTGDNELVSRKICREVGTPVEHVLLGAQVEAMSDAELAEAAGPATLFARPSPAPKQRVIRAPQRQGHVVGLLGVGINDAPAPRAADVGISADTAVDIAKESADAILLEKSLLVLGVCPAGRARVR